MNRFLLENETSVDRHTGLMWPIDAALLEFPMDWNAALESIRGLNRSGFLGHNDWKLPNRRELFSLMSHDTINPSLPAGHPFTGVFNGYYWTSSTCVRLPDQAWYVHLGGARVFKGMKYASYMVWPVRAAETDRRAGLFRTGQTRCFDSAGTAVDCRDTGQDGDLLAGREFPGERFEENGEAFLDRATGLTWLEDADISKGMTDWASAFDLIRGMNADRHGGYGDWRLPAIRELESLTDLNCHSPALPGTHPFRNVREFYWSSTTSMYDTEYAWVLYLTDGAVGVGFKTGADFHVWPVRGEGKGPTGG